MTLDGMTQATWDSLSAGERKTLRVPANHPQLNGLEGWRVEVVDHDGETRRFIVGMSTGWHPVHLEIKTVRSMGGFAADSRGYKSVRRVRKER